MNEPTLDAPDLQVLDTVNDVDARGTITFSPEVLVDMIELSAENVPGLVKFAGRHRAGKRALEIQAAEPSEPAGMPYEKRGIRVRMADDVIDADLAVVVEAGTTVPRLGRELQERVAVAVGRMLGMRVGEVNVRVVEVREGRLEASDAS